MLPILVALAAALLLVLGLIRLASRPTRPAPAPVPGAAGQVRLVDEAGHERPLDRGELEALLAPFREAAADGAEALARARALAAADAATLAALAAQSRRLLALSDELLAIHGGVRGGDAPARLMRLMNELDEIGFDLADREAELRHPDEALGNDARS